MAMTCSGASTGRGLRMRVPGSIACCESSSNAGTCAQTGGSAVAPLCPGRQPGCAGFPSLRSVTARLRFAGRAIRSRPGPTPDEENVTRTPNPSPLSRRLSGDEGRRRHDWNVSERAETKEVVVA